ncbi:MAG: transglycosylase domain-containing protein [Thermodesulfobacteriota bacterium]
MINKLGKSKLLKKFSVIFLFIISAAGLGTGIGYYTFALPDLNEITRLETYKPPLITRIFSSDNKLIKELYYEKRISHNTDHFSKDLVNALIVTEDRSFYNHSGLSPKGIARALVKDIIAMSFVEGASTITQQLAKTLFLSPEKKIKRKLIEMLLAFQIERRYTKKEILGLYLNQVYFGSGAYGAESAAKTYFNKSASELDIHEAALIAGMPKAPSYLSPLNNPDAAKQRRNQVLFNMVSTGTISETEYTKAKKAGLSLESEKKNNDDYIWYVNYIKKKLEKEIGYDLLYKSGLTINTSLNSKIQSYVEEAVEKNMPVLEKRMKAKNIDAKPECAVIVLDVKTRKVLAMTGGRNFPESKFNRAVMAKRQPGSAFKPFVYALALKNGYSQNFALRDAPSIFSVKGQKPWRPENFSKTYSGEVTMRKALADSKNIPAVRLLEKLDPEELSKMIKKFGISSRTGNTLSLALGTYETTLLELTNAFSVFPGKGIFKEPSFIEDIIRDNSVIYEKTNFAKERVYPEKEAAVLSDMLRAVMTEGTGRSGQINSHPLAGKTGTTDNFRDALFIGFSPSVAVGVWVGCDDNTSLGYPETGARAALPIWKDIMEKIIKDQKYPEYFPVPEGMIFKKFHPDSGEFITSDDQKWVKGMFIKEKLSH